MGGKLLSTLPVGDSKHTYKFRDGKDAIVAVRKENGSYPSYYRPMGDGKYERVVASKLPDNAIPLYNIQSVAEKDPEASVILVGTEYTADIVSLAVKTQAVVSWLGDWGSVKKTDWSPLEGHPITIIADATPDSRQTMRYMSDMLWTIGIKRIKAFYPPMEGMPGFTGHSISDWLEQCVTESGIDKSRRQKLIDDLQPYLHVYSPSNTLANVDALAQNAMRAKIKGDRDIVKSRVSLMLEDNDHFVVLGRHRGEITCQMRGSAELVSFKPESIPKSRMIQLADIEFWREMTGDDNLAEDSLDEIRNGINRVAQNKGMINLGNMRGRGAIEDNDKYYYHLGNKLLTESMDIVDLGDHGKSKYIYMECPPLEWKPPRNGWQEKAAQLSKALEMFNFQTRQDYLTWIGWLGSVIVCGIMPWRVHLWLYGDAQSGKSWLMQNTAMRLMGDFAEFSADYSEAAIARMIGSDAIPMMLDEGEPSEKSMEKILSLIKLTAQDAKRLRSQSGTASSVFVTTPRASFAVASTQIPSFKQTEATRIEVVKLRPPNPSRWADMDSQIDEALGNGWADDIRNGIMSGPRQMSDLVKIYEKKAINEFGAGSRRAKIAGMIFSGATIMGADILESDMRNFCTSESYQNDNEDILTSILDLIVEVTVPFGESGNSETVKKMAVHEMLSMTLGKSPAHRVCASAGRYGLRLKKEEGILHILIVPNMNTLNNELRRQANIKNIDIGASLKMIDGSSTDRSKFAGVQRRCIKIPESITAKLGYKFVEEIEPGGWDIDAA